MLHMSKKLSPPSKPSRVSVPLDAETLAVFQRLGKSANLSTGKAIAEWLRDTGEAADATAGVFERVQSATKRVTASVMTTTFQAFETSKVLHDAISKAKGPQAGAGPQGAGDTGTATPSVPPPCNTGGKVPQKTLKSGRRVS